MTRKLNSDEIATLLKELSASATDPEFYNQVYSGVSKGLKKVNQDENLIEKVCSEEYDQLSHHLDYSKVQESCAVRNVLRTRRIASLLINSEGNFQEETLDEMINQMRSHLYSLGPGRQYDSRRNEHILHVLEFLKDDALRKQLMGIGKPIGHRHAERIIRATLLLGRKIPVTDAHARRAVLSAWMCYLRQSVGSCFGTAPSILIQQEQPKLFLKDIHELLSKGQLTRVVDGKEYSVPLSHSWGGGDLKKPIILTKDHFNEEMDFHEKLWWSPGLLTALKKVEILSEEATISKRREKFKSLIVNVLEKVRKQNDLYITTCEELIRLIIIEECGLTEQAIKEFENRPRNMITSPFIAIPTTSRTKRKGSPGLCVSNIERAYREFVCLADNALLKAWEFSVASFAETKATFTKWNLYSSLGFGPEEPHGIGQCLHHIVQSQLDVANREVEKYQSEYEQVYLQVQMLRNRLRRAKNEQDARWIKMDYQSKLSEFESLEELRNKEHARAQKLASMFQVMIKKYYEFFPNYFQEVYDADMHLAVGQYDDSPAGFHLLYKHGRTNTSQWTSIRNANDFIESLVAFFTSTEHELIEGEELEGLKKDISNAVTAIVNHVRSHDFLETAFHRMAIAHKTPPIKNPLDNLDKIEKKPWSYTSGGNVETLINGYFARTQKIDVSERWVENVMELFVYTVDKLKQVPGNEMDQYLEIPDKSFLMHSPTHVFLLKPNREPFRKTWENNAYTYIWLRDHYKQPMDQFIHETKLNDEMMQFIVHGIVQNLHPNVQPQIKQIFRRFPREMRSYELRNHILQNTGTGSQISQYRKTISSEEIDTFLFENLPLFPNYHLRDRLEMLIDQIKELSEEEKKQALKLYDKQLKTRAGSYIISSKMLINICKALICLTLGHTSSSYDFHYSVQKAAQKLGFAFPEPAIFADTNWVKGSFGFLVNPGTAELELWHLDDTGSEGFPMNFWKQWLNGSKKEPKWGIYTKPYEYTAP